MLAAACESEHTLVNNLSCHVVGFGCNSLTTKIQSMLGQMY